MTTAHRPTFDPARGGTGRNEGDLSKLSTQYSSKDMPSHKKLKYREPQIIDEHRSKDLRRVLEEKESKGKGGSSSSSVPQKKLRLEASSDSNVDKDDPLDDDDDSDEDSDDDEALMAELEAIKKERAAEKVAKEARDAAEQERVRRENLLKGNPLLQADSAADFKVKRRWDDDVVFKNCAKGTDSKKAPTFINDSIRSEFHRKFMEKYIK